MKTLRLVLIGAAAAVAGFALQSCGTQQPPPECNVTAGAAVFGVTNYYGKLTKTSETGTCTATMGDLEVGLQRFAPADGGAFKLGVRPSRTVDFYNGLLFSEFLGGMAGIANDCSDRTMSANGTCYKSDGGPNCEPPAFPPPRNICRAVRDPVPRYDADDLDGEKLTGLTPFPKNPTNGICQATNFAIEQNFRPEPLSLVDGGTSTLPGFLTKLEFTDFNVIMSAKAPGTAFTAKLTYTEGPCVQNFDVKGFWPIVHCEPQPVLEDGGLGSPEQQQASANTQCDPKSDLDAGRVFGSGISPDFAPLCNLDVGVCEPSVDFATLAK